ncbi:MAG: right-handed parallel beta-helix repeat-containing protein [Planctomycetia bacterium]|nr:right-handed parallel beta-helix repeat-containing protein [Planctomycetia bacterium]
MSIAVCSTTGAAFAVELHSNGLGGGEWSDPLSWREKVAPTAADDVVISRGDVITFDRNDDGKTSCNRIYIDPNGSFVFKTGAGRIVCCPAGQVESFGVILIDGTRSAADKFELRMVGATADERVVTLLKGGKLTINGRRNLAHGKHNVVISTAVEPAVKDAPVKAPIEATVAAKDGASIDAQRAEIMNVHLTANDIDNTGAEVGERVNLVGNSFTGVAHMSITSCDSPLIADNRFELAAGLASPHSAMFVNGCYLAEIRGNLVRGRFSFGIQARSMTDSTLTDCDFEGQATGVYWYGTNGMLKDLMIRKCDTGLTMTSASGVVEDTLVEGCKTGYYHGPSTVQMTNVRIVDLQKDGTSVLYYNGPLKLLNCNVTAEQIKTAGTVDRNTPDGSPPIECLNFLVVRPSGKLPPGTRVEVVSADRATAAAKSPAAARAADPNVRNSPSTLRSDGLTPLPDSLEPLIVRSWSFDAAMKPIAAPSYVVRVLLPAGDSKSAAATKPLAELKVAPDASWYREEPNKPTPTLEVPIP